MNNTMKRRMIAFVAAIAAVVSLSGCDDNYDETPPLAKDYLTKYITNTPGPSVDQNSTSPSVRRLNTATRVCAKGLILRNNSSNCEFVNGIDTCSIVVVSASKNVDWFANFGSSTLQDTRYRIIPNNKTSFFIN